MIRKLLSSLFSFMLVAGLFAQGTAIKGSVKSASGGDGVSFANVQVLGTTNGMVTDDYGNFSLTIDSPIAIVVSAIGFKTDTVKLVKGKTSYTVALNTSENNLNEVVVSGTMQETSKTESPIPVEVYSAKLFRKNPSPNIFEAMNMINGVQPQLNCNVCNTGDIHINGMEGPYTMILIDGMPVVSSLSTVYGLMGIPQSLVKRIEVVKGPSSTLYGSEAVAGLVNIITASPESSPRLKIEQTASSAGEFNTDIAAAFKMKKAQTLLGINYFNFLFKWDVNNDNFTDVTLQNRLSLFNKWNFTRKSGRLASLAARYIYEDRWGGEMQWTKKFRGTDSIYGESIYTQRVELIGVYQLPTGKESTFFDYSYNFHYQDSYYGTIKYLATQHVVFAQLRWNKNWKKISLLAGIPFRFIHYDDNTYATANETQTATRPAVTFLPGVFVQTEYKPVEQFTVLAGMRYEYHNEHKSIFSPRLSFKITPHRNHTIRLSGGNGFRVVNLFTEDHAALTGARKVIVAEKLKPEQSWNGNINYTTTIQHKAGFVGIDVSGFYTYFTNKIVADYTTNAQQIIYDNLRGYAVSAGASGNIDLNFTNGLKILLGATYMQVYQVEKGIKTPQMHAPKFSATYTASYTFNKIGFTIDYTGKINSPMYLPVVPNDFRPSQSPWYCIMNLQFTKKFSKGIELFAGVKNFLNFIPKNPILRADDPFNKRINENNPNGYTFDPSYNYAPIQGAKGYVGLRYTLD
ncbi:MAG TPA: TonB-dependent receptor [Chitinophagales bacterium]|nr:TonB-dependent receptor [Chitinophagales bacterium]